MSIDLARLVALVGIKPEPRFAEIAIKDVTHDSRKTEPGALFAAVTGSSFDGHDYAKAAIESGAVALIVERSLHLGVPELKVDSVREVLGPISAAVHDNPSKALQLIGITGTNGKTTTVHILCYLLRTLGVKVAEIGTLTDARTTPEAPELHRQLADAVRHRRSVVAMEVSSHGLAQHRLTGCRFSIAAFTNLGDDHLDYHGTTEEYFAAKRALFTPELTELAVINVANEFGKRLADESQIPVVRVGDNLTDLIRLDRQMSEFRWRKQTVQLPLAGTFNVANATMAAEIALVLGHKESEIADALAVTPAVPGRFEVIDQGQQFMVIVDYAHTADALEAVLNAARALTTNQLLVVFGAGGNRQRDKRPVMGKVAQDLADWVGVTNDNPRDEPAQEIIADIVSGMSTPPDLIEQDRRQAIANAFNAASEGDLVLIAGKGHETTQTIGTQLLPFDDRLVAHEELKKLMGVSS